MNLPRVAALFLNKWHSEYIALRHAFQFIVCDDIIRIRSFDALFPSLTQFYIQLHLFGNCPSAPPCAPASVCAVCRVRAVTGVVTTPSRPSSG